jgi:hypothetical protein
MLATLKELIFKPTNAWFLPQIAAVLAFNRDHLKIFQVSLVLILQ